MTARTWKEGDPEPPDHPAVVDPEGVTWVWRDDDDVDLGTGYHQQLITHLGGTGHGDGIVTMGSICNDWEDIFGSLLKGAVLREATEEETRIWVERWPAEAT